MQFFGRTKLKLFVFILGGLSLLTLFFGYQAIAAPQPISLTTSPILLNLSVLPGSTTVQTVELMNNSSTAVPINMELMTFGADGTNGDAAITAIPPSNPEAKYISFSPTSFVAQPKVWSKVQVTIVLPKSANLGYYYAIVFQPVYSVGRQPGKNIIEGSNAILALLNTNSANEQKSIHVASFTLSKSIYEYLPAIFNVNIRNSGNIYLAPHGDIFISRVSSGGQSITAIPVNGGGGNVLPNSNRVFSASWTNGFPLYTPVLKDGNPLYNNHNQVEYNLKWNFSNVNKFRFGKYYANLILTYNNGSRSVLLTGQLSFWVIPWEILLVLVVIVLIILLNVYLIGRSIFRRAKRIRSKRSKAA